MKNKHNGIFSIIVIVISVLLFLGYGYYLRTTVNASIKVSRPAPLPATNIPDDNTLKKMAKLNDLLFSLARLTDDSKPFSMKIFGWNPVVEQAKYSSLSEFDTDYEVPVDFSYKLTLCFESEKSGFCRIDNVLYAQGSILPDDGKIVKIEHDRVQIKKNNLKKWIYLSRQADLSNQVEETEKTASTKEKI